MRCTLLVLGENEEQARSLSEKLSDSEMEIEVIADQTAENLPAILQMVNIDCVLLNHKIGQFNALEHISIIQQRVPDCGIILTVDNCQPGFVREVFKTGVDDCLISPDLATMYTSIISVIQQKKEQKLERNANAELALLRYVVENTPSLIMVCDPQTSLFITFNQALNRFLDLSNEQIKSRSYFHLSEQFDSISDWFQFVDKVKNSGHYAYEAYLKNSKGESVPFEFDCSVKSINGHEYLLFNGMDISRLKSVQNELIELASRDPLTQLRNRRGLTDEFNRLLKASIRANTCLCLAIFDLDNFKQINDQYGHDCGDQILRNFAQVLKSVARRPLDLIVRAGGEEFIVITVNGTAESLQRMMNKIIEQTPLATEPATTVSGGAVCIANQKITHYEQVFKLADNNLYQAKQQGKNQLIMTVLDK